MSPFECEGGVPQLVIPRDMIQMSEDRKIDNDEILVCIILVLLVAFEVVRHQTRLSRNCKATLHHWYPVRPDEIVVGPSVLEVLNLELRPCCPPV